MNLCRTGVVRVLEHRLHLVSRGLGSVLQVVHAYHHRNYSGPQPTGAVGGGQHPAALFVVGYQRAPTKVLAHLLQRHLPPRPATGHWRAVDDPVPPYQRHEATNSMEETY